MLQGTVKFFNDVKGFGFIEPADGGKDVFFHFSGMKEGSSVNKNDKGRSVTYDLKPGKNGDEASEVVIVK